MADHLSELKQCDLAQAKSYRLKMNASLASAYRAVAFDIDGTLTEPGSVQLDAATLQEIGRLLSRGVPVILVTGRGKTGATETLSSLRDSKVVSNQYLKRLTIIADNGATVFRVLVDDSVVLSEPENISPTLQSRDDIVKRLRQAIEQFPYADIDVKPGTIRIVARTGDREKQHAVLTSVKNCHSELEELAGRSIFVEAGTYSTDLGINVSTTHKGLALQSVLKDMGIPPEKILRIGDHGEEDGNDFHLLNSCSGFSVGSVSKSLDGCFPVLDCDGSQLVGPDATKYLLTVARIMPPLSLLPTAVAAKATYIIRAEGIAKTRSRLEMRRLQRSMLSRLRSLCIFTPGQLAFRDERCDDFFDAKSGAVVLHEHEFVDADPLDDLIHLFEIPIPSYQAPEYPGLRWCMFTDSAVILRGPQYYAGLRSDATIHDLVSYLEEHIKFCTGAATAIARKSTVTPTLLDIKLIAGVLDHARSSLLYSLCAAYDIAASDFKDTAEDILRGATRVLASLVDLLWEGRLSYKHQFIEVGNALGDVSSVLTSFLHKVLALPRCEASPGQDKVQGEQEPTRKLRLLKWRECDSMAENYLATNMALSEFTTRNRLREDCFNAVGILSGGVELPLMAAVVAERRGFRCQPVYVRRSSYGNNDISGEMSFWPVAPLEGVDCILMDDNVTTGRTLQDVQDYCLAQGHSLTGAVVVRFPGANRIQHMMLPEHGCVDPDVLFAYVRGLVAASPYTRLPYRSNVDIATGQGNTYLDSRAKFDKARDRVTDLLDKNCKKGETYD